MTPYEALKLYRIYRAYLKDEKENTTMSVKIPQLTTLLVSLFGTIGAPTMAQNWLHKHFILYVTCVSIAIGLHALLPSIFQSTPSATDQQNTGFASKTSAIILCLLACSIFTRTVHAQVNNLYMAGASYSAQGQPSTAGTALYAHLINNSGTYAFTMIDALPASYKPFTVSTNIGVGIAQNLFTIDKVQFMVPTDAGISFTGDNIGWTWSTGLGVPIQLKSKGNWYAMPTVRVLKSSVTGSTTYQPIVGILFGWGQ